MYSSLPPHELFGDIPRARDFYYPSFSNLDEAYLNKPQKQFVDFCKKCFERDKNDFVESLIWNNHFWETKKDREFLKDISWNLAEDPQYDMLVPNLYNTREQYFILNNPAFFKDDESIEIPFENTVEGKLSKLQAELDKLRDGIESQSLEDLADQQRAHFESIVEGAQDQIVRLSAIVSDKTDELAKTIAQGTLAQQFNALETRIRRQGALIWILIIVLVVIGYLNATLIFPSISAVIPTYLWFGGGALRVCASTRTACLIFNQNLFDAPVVENTKNYLMITLKRQYRRTLPAKWARNASILSLPNSH